MGSVKVLCVPRSVWDCCLIAMFTRQLHPMSLAHSVVSFVLSHHSIAAWGHYCSTGLSEENWHILCGESWFTPWSYFLCVFKQPWGQLIFDQSISWGLLLLLMVCLALAHMSLCIWWDTKLQPFITWKMNETKKRIHILLKSSVNLKMHN